MSDAATPYERLGGESVVRQLTDRFYDLMDELPEARTVRALHPESLSGSREKFFEFLSGWLGGPQRYVERHGHPRLRMRHMPFAIDEHAARAWMTCMIRALDEIVTDPLLRENLRGAFQRMADHLRNADEFRRPEDG